jgi:hypothetical protein
MAGVLMLQPPAQAADGAEPAQLTLAAEALHAERA